jgi:type V secretory pathway adhesin AidA
MAVRNDFTAGEVLAAADLNDTFAAKLNLAGGKVLQVVRATDSTNRTTTSATFVDASISVTITPQKSDSAVLLLYAARFGPAPDAYVFVQITDSSNNSISGTQELTAGGSNAGTFAMFGVAIGYATPATTSPVTYKVRFRSSSGTATLVNSGATGQLYAIEVSA